MYISNTLKKISALKKKKLYLNGTLSLKKIQAIYKATDRIITYLIIYSEDVTLNWYENDEKDLDFLSKFFALKRNWYLGKVVTERGPVLTKNAKPWSE